MAVRACDMPSGHICVGPVGRPLEEVELGFHQTLEKRCAGLPICKRLEKETLVSGTTCLVK